MKKWMMLTAMVMAGSGALASTKQTCTSVTGEKLVVTDLTNQDQTSTQVEFTSEGVLTQFSGTWQMGVGYSMNPSQSGESVLLKISKIKSPGGRCGRCATFAFEDIYAKLTIGNTVYNFQCDPAVYIPSL